MKRTHILVATALFTLTGCANDHLKDLADWIAQVKSQQQSNVEPLPTIKRYESFIYSAAHLRSPFEDIMSEQKLATTEDNNGISPDLERRKEALERFPLDSLRMVGTLKKDNTVWALVQAPDVTIHKVSTGNYLGQHHGKITSIDDFNTQLVEIIPDGAGSWMERDAAISLIEEETTP